MLGMVSQNVNFLVVSDEVLTPEVKDDDLKSLESDPIVDSSLSVVNENSSFCGDEFISYEVSTNLGIKSSIDTEKSITTVNIVSTTTNLGVSNIVADVAVSLVEKTGVRSGPNTTTGVLHQPTLERSVTGIVGGRCTCNCTSISENSYSNANWLYGT